MLDLCSQTMMFVGLTLIPASVYQMLRSAVVVFTAIESMLILKRKQYRHHWTAIVLIILGVFQVGLVNMKQGGGGSDTSGGDQFLGMMLVIFAQLFTAT